MRVTRTAAVAAGLTGLLCAAAPAALAAPAPAPASPATASTATAAATAAAAAAPVVRGGIGYRYASLGGRAGFLGAPLANEAPTYPRSGAFQNFQGGSIFWSPATGAWEVHGAIREKWFSQKAENGPLGFPTSNELRSTTAPGAASTFERGAIVWSPTTGAHRLGGAILGAWLDLDQESGPLGFPSSDEIALPKVNAVVQFFTGATVYYSPATGIGFVRGGIQQRWGQLGFENGPLGLPIGGEIKQTDGSVRQQFEAGVLSYSSSTGVQVVRVIGYAGRDAAAPTVIVEGVESQPFSYTGSEDAFGSISVLDPAQIVTPLTQPQFLALFTPGARVLVVVTHDPASGRNVFTVVRDVPPSGSLKAGQLRRYLALVKR